MRGSKPKPIETKIRDGNPRKESLPAVVQLPPNTPMKPDLPAEASWMWDEIVPILSEHGVAQTVDGAALTAMCLQWQRACDARKIVETEGLLTLSSSGQLITHPLVTAERDATLAFLRYAEHFAVTPVARARVAIAAKGMQSMAEELKDL